MPILLLPQLVAALRKLGTQLSPWGPLAQIEEQLLRRARSAFMVKWFGTGIPTRGIHLLINIDNIEELKARYRLVEASRRSSTRLNLFAPLAGFFGVTMGILFNPVGGTLMGTLVRMLDEGFDRSGFIAIFAEVIYRLFIEHGSLPFWASVAGLGLLVIAAPLLLVVGLGAGLGGNRLVRAIYDLLGEAAMLVDAFLRFWDQITGPLDQIRNPLVRAVMGILHLIAALMVQVTGFVALLIVKLVPLIPSLVAQYRAMMALLDTVVEIARQTLKGIGETLMAPFNARGGIRAILTGLLDRLATLPDTLLGVIATVLEDATTLLSDGFGTVLDRLQTWIADLRTGIRALFMTSPIGRLYERIQVLLGVLPQVRLAFEAITAPPAPPPPPARAWYERAWDAVGEGAANAGAWVGDAYLGGILEAIDDTKAAAGRLSFPDFPDISVPDFPAFPGLPVIADIEALVGTAPEIDLGATREALMADARTRARQLELSPALRRRPRSAFGDERALLDAMGPPVVSAREQRLRDVIYTAVGRVLPPALRLHATDVRALFDQVDHAIYDGPEPPEPPVEFPALELQDSGRLQTRIGLLSIEQVGGIAADLRAFEALLSDVMQNQSYYAADAG